MPGIRIDVHQHLIPPVYGEWLAHAGIRDAGGRDLPAWSAPAALELMENHGIATAIVSISTPGVYFPNGASAPSPARMARTLNEFAAGLARDHPGRFRFFATLPVLDTDAALAELAYAFDVLHASGIILLANVGGRYLGAPEDEPLFAELERRAAVVFVHPSTLPGPSVDDIPPFAADFLLDTTRAAFRLVRHDFVRRYPNVKILLAHAGGFVPYASHRLAAAITAATQHPPFEVLEDFSSFYFDTALSSSPAALPSLLAFAKPGHVLFGSDWPYAPDLAVNYFTLQLDAYPGFDVATRAAVNRGNAEALFPGLALQEKP